MAAETHFRELPFQCGKGDSEGPRRKAFVAETCFESEHDLLPAQFLERSDPLDLRSPVML